eukprot:TRINITY_DN56323_c0_g1_i1.p1 TRINITY_DN56323_c0_g1~~TRINITY_DN56323_c0_g1_i1.p1  ORF type:complete len:296 (-),score=-6.20 TRINITY_DN56323_c0_g1_i1:34-921(-)
MSSDNNNLPSKDETLEKLKNAFVRAAQGGIAGASAMAIQVCTLMWIRTTVNYQYRYGMTTTGAFKHLWNDGGIPRFYRGLLPALFQGPLSRFGDTASNAGTIVLLDSFEFTRNLPSMIKSVAASATASGFRILLMPIDTIKTTMQVEGKGGFGKLLAKAKTNGISTFFHGSLAAVSATFVGHYPWFATYNYLNATLPSYNDDKLKKLARNAGIGFICSAVSDTCSNSLRVMKVYRQASTEKISYVEVAKRVIEKEGYIGLFGRGLKTKIMANGIQGIMFSVLWKYLDEAMFGIKK